MIVYLDVKVGSIRDNIEKKNKFSVYFPLFLVKEKVKKLINKQTNNQHGSMVGQQSSPIFKI